MPPIDKIKTTEFGPGLLGTNPELVTDIYPVYLSTVL
jgi:hypothetical protein